jgi:hypothetical protein
MKNVHNLGEKTPHAPLRRGIRHSFVICLGLLCLLLPAKSFAQSSNRWLFVYNTSSAMHDRVRGMESITYDLLTTAMHGNLKAGDTIGIWTFNNKLSADEAPLQDWSPAASQSILQNTMQFLDKHHYEKSAVFDDVLANMLRVVKNSDVITIILISDGADPIIGTPFDARISAFYKTNYQTQKKAKMPVVTLFRGEKGVITTNTLAVPQWPLEIPAVPPPPVVVKAAVPKPAPVAPSKPVPSLVIIGKKAETTFNPPTDLPDHVDQVTLPPVVEQPPVAAKPEVPPPTPEPVPALKVEEKPAPVVAPVVTAPIPLPAVVVAPPKPVEPTPVVAAAAPAVAEPPPTVTAPVAPVPVQTVAPVPGINLFSVRNIAIFSIAFTVLVCGYLVLAARNARNASQASLITRSLDREAR